MNSSILDSVVLEESYSSRLREVYKLPSGPRTLDELAQLWNLGYSKRFAYERGKQVFESLKRGDMVYGETKAETRHVVQLRGREKVHVNCAIDALIEGFFQDLDIESSCPHCKDGISIQMVDRKVVSAVPESAVLWLGISPHGEGPTVEVLCPFINFFTSEDHARHWHEKNPEQVGVLLTLSLALGFISKALSI